MKGLCLGIVFMVASTILVGCGGSDYAPPTPAGMQNVPPEQLGQASTDLMKSMNGTPGSPPVAPVTPTR